MLLSQFLVERAAFTGSGVSRAIEIPEQGAFAGVAVGGFQA